MIALLGDRGWREDLDATSDHALLVLLGHYARQLGLLDQLEAVPIDQRTRVHTPQTKLIQLLVGVLGGLDHLQDFNEAARPLVKDRAVIASWGQPAFAHYSGVSRTLEAADEQTLKLKSSVDGRQFLRLLLRSDEILLATYNRSEPFRSRYFMHEYPTSERLGLLSCIGRMDTTPTSIIIAAITASKVYIIPFITTPLSSRNQRRASRPFSR